MALQYLTPALQQNRLAALLQAYVNSLGQQQAVGPDVQGPEPGPAPGGGIIGPDDFQPQFGTLGPDEHQPGLRSFGTLGPDEHQPGFASDYLTQLLQQTGDTGRLPPLSGSTTPVPQRARTALSQRYF